MAHTSLENPLEQSRHLSFLIIEEILNKIITSSLSGPSSSYVADFDVVDSSCGQTTPECSDNEATHAFQAAENKQGLPARKRVTFCEDVTVVSYEVAVTTDREENNDAALMSNDCEQEKEGLKIYMYKVKEGVVDGLVMIKEQESEAFQTYEMKEDSHRGSVSEVEDNCKEKKTFCDMDGNLLKRKCLDIDLEDDCIIPTKVMKPEGDSLDHQNEGETKVDRIYLHDDKSQVKVELGKADLEATMRVSGSEEIAKEKHKSTATTRSAASTCVCGPPDSKIHNNLVALSLNQDDNQTDMEDAVLNEVSSSNDGVIEDCRFVLQTIVDNTLLQMEIYSKSDENTKGAGDTDEQPALKKIKLAPPSDQGINGSFLSNIADQGFLREVDSSLRDNIIVNLSTADVEQLCVTETTDIKEYSNTPAILCERPSLELSPAMESESGSRPQPASDPTSVSTSTPDVIESKDVDVTKVMDAAESCSPPDDPSTYERHDILNFNENIAWKVCAHPTAPDVEVIADVQSVDPRRESDIYSSVLAQDLYLDDSVECSEPSEAFQSGLHIDEAYDVEDLLLSSADVEVFKSVEVLIDPIEPSLQEDIMPSSGSSVDDFSCTFQKASQVLISSQDETSYCQSFDKLLGLSSTDDKLEMTKEDLQVPNFVSVEPVKEEVMQDAVVGDWEAPLSLPDKDDSLSKVSQIPVLEHPGFIHEQLINVQHGDCKARDTSSKLPEHHFLQVLGLSPKQHTCMVRSEEQTKPFDSSASEALPTSMMSSSSKSIEEMKNEPCVSLLHPMCGNLGCSPVEHSEVKSTSNVETVQELSSDQTVPSLQTPVRDNPSIDQLLELEESIFTEQDVKQVKAPVKQCSPALEDTSCFEDGGDEPIPDHLQTLGQKAAGVFHWNHSLADVPLTPSLIQDQSILQCRAYHLDQTPPITPVRPLPACNRRRRVGLSRRQLVYPLHERTSSRK